MNDFQSEIIGFCIVAIVVIMLAFFTSKLEKKYNNKDQEDI